MVKKNTTPQKTSLHTVQRHKLSWRWIVLLFSLFIVFGLSIGFVLSLILFEQQYKNKVYPGVRVDSVNFSGKTPEEVEAYFLQRSKPFANLQVTLSFEDNIATISGIDLAASFDASFSKTQAYSVGRTGHFLTDTYQKWRAATTGIFLNSLFKMNTLFIDDVLANLQIHINTSPQDALFQFEQGKVKSFQVSKPGRHLDTEKTKQMILTYIHSVGNDPRALLPDYVLPLPVVSDAPKISTENSNNLGIKELLATGTSRFHHSIPGRVHNVELAASKINGHLIAPGTEFSFNDALGDVSAATGFAPAYIIKEGRTVLGDGGGVCQVSTTLFRAALATGLPISERHAHAYRVGYYEEESPPGIDATVFAPGYDLKIKNDTGNYILIQARIDTANYALAFDFYGTKDGRTVNMTKPALYSQTPPPADLYQDDPTLPVGVVKQVDWSAYGGKTSFDYTVTRGNEVLTKQTFYSNYQAWRAIYLRGTKT
jgi:vancomycin resistance protein YoaR